MNWKKILNGLENTGLAIADTTLGTFGASNIIEDDMYKGKSGQDFANTANAAGTITKTLAPIALNVLAPGSGTALSGLTSAAGAALPALQMPDGGRVPIVTLDPKDPRLTSYNDSLNLYNAYQFQKKNTNYAALVKDYSDESNKLEINKNNPVTPEELQKIRDKNLGKPGSKNNTKLLTYNNLDKDTRNYDPMEPRYGDEKIYNYYKSLHFNEPTKIGKYSSPDLVHKSINPVGMYFDGIANSPIYKKPVQPVILQKDLNALEKQKNVKVEEQKQVSPEEQARNLKPIESKINSIQVSDPEFQSFNNQDPLFRKQYTNWGPVNYYKYDTSSKQWYQTNEKSWNYELQNSKNPNYYEQDLRTGLYNSDGSPKGYILIDNKKMMNGGLNGQPNVELEKQEVFQTPNGQVRQVDAPPHSQGGTGSMNLPGNTKVFSDRLKTKSGKTFAEEAAQYNTAKWEKILNSPNSDGFAKKTAEKMIANSNKKLDFLFAQQELLKGNDAAKKLEKINKQETLQMPNGGIVDPETGLPQSRNTLEVMNYALNSGLFPGTNYPQMPDTNPLPNTTEPAELYNPMMKFTQAPYAGDDEVPSKLDGRYLNMTPGTPIDPRMKPGQLPFNPTEVEPMSLDRFGESPVTENNFNMDPYFSLATAGNMLGSLYDIYRGVKGGDEVNYERVNPELVSFAEARKNAVQETNRGFNMTKGAIKEGSRGNAGTYLSNVGNASALRDQGNRQMISQSVENEQNMNAQIKNQAKSQNAQIQMSEVEARQKEKDIASNTLATGLYNLGSALNTFGTDMQLKGNEPILKALIATGDYDYVYGKNGKPLGIKSKTSGKITGLSGLQKKQQEELKNLQDSLPK